MNQVAISLTDSPVTQTPLTEVNKASINVIVPEIGRNNNNIPPKMHKKKKVTGKILTGDLTASEYILSINKSYNLFKLFSILNTF